MRYWALFCAIAAAVSMLAAFPRAQRERRLSRHGRTATGICRGHLNPKEEGGPMRVRCGIRTHPEQKGEIWVVVRTHDRIPQVGDEFTIVYAPGCPSGPRSSSSTEVARRRPRADSTGPETFQVPRAFVASEAVSRTAKGLPPVEQWRGREMSHITRKVAVGFLAACGALGGAVAPATAADYPTAEFRVSKTSGANGYTDGTITWFNRTANVQGDVVDLADGAPSTVAVFEAFAGSTKIDSETRTANDDSDLGTVRDFNFTIGDTDLVGGIDRIKITVCTQYSWGSACSDSVNYSK